jgi:hypothetical protein
MDKLIVDSKKVAEIKYKALQKLAANQDRPLSEASIEARAVIEVVNELYELNEVSPQANPAICNYSGLRPVEGYQEEIDKEIKKAIIANLDTEEGKELVEVFRRGWLAGYKEGLYDKEVK